MANIGDQLLTPETGWQGIDDTNTNLLYNNNWSNMSKSTFYNSTIHYCHVNNGILTFYFYGSKVRLVGNMSDAYSTKNKIKIDGIEEQLSCYNSTIVDGANSAYIRLLYEKTGLNQKIHKVEIETVAESGKKYCIAFDRLDIDDDGHMCTEDEYLLQEGKAEFPVKVADDSVVTEADVLSYASTLVNGEKQLLVSEKLKKIYVTDGQGGMTELSSSSSGSGVEIDDTTPSFGKVYSSKQTQTLIDNVVNNTLDKETYASETNEGAVKYADNLSVTMNTQPLQYYGTNNENELGMHYFPINTKDNTGLEQRVCLNAKANQIITVDSALDISDNKVIVDCYKFVSGEENVISTIKTFDNTEKDNFFYDKDNIEFTDSMHIKKEYELVLNKNNEGFYESEEIDINKFLELTLSEVNN